MLGFARVFVALVAAMMIAFGLWLATQSDPSAPVFGLFTAGLGVGGLVAIVMERMRYSSERDEDAGRAPRSPGGDGPDEVLEARFRPTEERFLDPGSGVPMRVYLDPGTGERRYRRDDRI